MMTTTSGTRWVTLLIAGGIFLAPASAFGRDGRELAEGASLALHVTRGDYVFRHRGGQTLQPGDTVRVVPKAPKGYGYFMALWQGKNGEVEVICPWRGGRSEALPEPGEPARGAAALDAQLGPEALVALYSHEPLLAADVVPWAEGYGGIVEEGSFRIGDHGVEVVVLEYEKVAPRSGRSH